MIRTANQLRREITVNCVKMVIILIHNEKSVHKNLTNVHQSLRKDIAHRVSLVLLLIKIGNASK